MIKSEARGKEEGKKVSGNRIVEQEEHKGDDNPENRRWLLFFGYIYTLNSAMTALLFQSQ